MILSVFYILLYLIILLTNIKYMWIFDNLRSKLEEQIDSGNLDKAVDEGTEDVVSLVKWIINRVDTDTNMVVTDLLKESDEKIEEEKELSQIVLQKKIELWLDISEVSIKDWEKQVENKTEKILLQ